MVDAESIRKNIDPLAAALCGTEYDELIEQLASELDDPRCVYCGEEVPCVRDFVAP